MLQTHFRPTGVINLHDRWWYERKMCMISTSLISQFSCESFCLFAAKWVLLSSFLFIQVCRTDKELWFKMWLWWPMINIFTKILLKGLKKHVYGSVVYTSTFYAPFSGRKTESLIQFWNWNFRSYFWVLENADIWHCLKIFHFFTLYINVFKCF